MANKKRLRSLRAGTVINLTSLKQETSLGKALKTVSQQVVNEFGLQLKHVASWKLCDIVERLKKEFPDVRFECHHQTSSMRPDGGILSLVAPDSEQMFPILISEVKNQGTNDLRKKEGLKKQAKGNAIERLGKNVIGFRVAMRNENILPFVCFGYGCDFVSDSSILDRVSTIAMFTRLNTSEVVNTGPNGLFNRGSFYFRQEAWTQEEMECVMLDIASRSIHYYLAKYGKIAFIPAT